MGEKIKTAIERILLETGWTQGEMSERLDVHESYFADVKNGRRPVTAALMRKIRENPDTKGYYPAIVKAVTEESTLTMPFELNADRPWQIRLATILALLWDDLPEAGAKRLAKAAWSEYERHADGTD